jgi:hypothetical protein
MAVSGLLEPHRAARLIEFHARDASNPDFKAVVDAMVNSTWKPSLLKSAYHQAIARAVQSLTITRLMELAANGEASPQVRAVATESLRELNTSLKVAVAPGADAAHRRATQEDIERFLARPDATRKQTAPLPTPPGDPIGSKSQSR